MEEETVGLKLVSIRLPEERETYDLPEILIEAAEKMGMKVIEGNSLIDEPDIVFIDDTKYKNLMVKMGGARINYDKGFDILYGSFFGPASLTDEQVSEYLEHVDGLLQERADEED
jgi:hypothetical protein